MWKENVCMWKDNVCMWNENVCVWESENICMWEDNICMWKENISVLKENVCMWKENVCVWESQNELCLVRPLIHVIRNWPVRHICSNWQCLSDKWWEHCYTIISLVANSRSLWVKFVKQFFWKRARRLTESDFMLSQTETEHHSHIYHFNKKRKTHNLTPPLSW